MNKFTRFTLSGGGSLPTIMFGTHTTFYDRSDKVANGVLKGIRAGNRVRMKEEPRGRHEAKTVSQIGKLKKLLVQCHILDEIRYSFLIGERFTRCPDIVTLFKIPLFLMMPRINIVLSYASWPRMSLY